MPNRHKFESTVSMLDSNVYGHHFTVPQDVADLYLDTDKRMICVINGVEKIHCAFMPRGNGEYMILLNKELRKKHNLNVGDAVLLEVYKDESEYGMAVPEELLELWDIDPDGVEIFHQLTKGKQRNLIHLVSKGKRSETRAKKAVAIMEYLKTVGGKLDFREMNQFIKNYNSL